MQFSNLLLAALAASVTVAAPINSIERRDEICGQWDTVVEGQYTLYQDLWGKSAATSGSQCSTADSISGTTLAWHTEWTWSGGSASVKSYANAVVKMTATKLSKLSTIPTTWKWSYTGSDIVADVSYDSFLGSTPTGSADYEVMVWLAALGGAGPISSTGSPIATPTIDGVTYKLYSGPNGSTTVFSFVAESSVENFEADLINIFKYLENSQGVSSSQYLQSIGAGTEPFTGSNAVFTTSAYSITVS